MPCSPVKRPDGTLVLVRHEKPRPRACSVCKRKTSEYLMCDFQLTGWKRATCDAVLCSACADRRDGVTLCPLHAAAADGKLRL